jgi:hypothetical protein
MAWDVPDAASGAPWGYAQWDADDPEGAPSTPFLVRHPRRLLPHARRRCRCCAPQRW